MARKKTETKAKVTYRETYRAHAAMINEGRLPTLQHSNGMQPDLAEITEAGHCEWRGESYEFQVIKLYFKKD